MNSLLRIHRVTLENIRFLKEVTCDLDPDTTLLFGANSSGKTAFVEANSVELGALFVGMENIQATLMRKDDRRRPGHGRGPVGKTR